ncbi:hypothetical protein AsFPU1_2607 [Aphanothece sacrum FPU1]|uniref:Uncharacterized protein n=1 Tax=Aphanothece sacrum FPU1 TaxID=1920663 RepID=A0A401IIQ4_APHSA|nr:hypothetical protein AsFPU1_2607 [Aphanothece sacrum FPU1]GBF83456.1 hypothetical protein AsFPU3_0498 [Aphanothece sacrum FPU3]
MLNFSTQKKARDSKPFRLALATLIIKEKLGTSDRETVEQIKENPLEELIKAGPSLNNLSKRQQNLLLVVKKVYEQQQEMWEKNTQSVPQRIISLTQPHIRPIVRGKAGKPTEFGAKLSVSCVDNYLNAKRGLPLDRPSG